MRVDPYAGCLRSEACRQPGEAEQVFYNSHGGHSARAPQTYRSEVKRFRPLARCGTGKTGSHPSIGRYA